MIKTRDLPTEMNKLAYADQEKIDGEIRELVGLLKYERPELTKDQLQGIISSATRYAKELLKGRAAELYGMSLDWAIATLKDPKANPKDKKDVVLKVLGHMLPTQVTVAGDEDSKPILFQMARPVTVYDAEQTDISSSTTTGQVS